MTTDNDPDDIDSQRRTTITTIGALGVGLGGLTGMSDVADARYGRKPGRSRGRKRGHEKDGGCGKWCRGRGRGRGHERGKGYERDHPHYDDHTRWDDRNDWWRDANRKEGTDEGDEEDGENDEGPDGGEDEAEPDDGQEDEREQEDDREQGREEDDDNQEGDEDQNDDGTDDQAGDDSDTSDVATRIERRMHAEVNEYRAENGLDPLSFDEALADVARSHSEDMNDRDYFSHTSPEGAGPGDRLDAAGIDCYAWAENIAYEYDSSFGEEDADSVADSIVQGWIDSAGHRRNVLGDYDEQGIGVDVRDDGRVTATQLFCSSR